METASEDDKFKDSYVELEDHQSEDENQMFYHEHAEDSIGQESLLDRPWEPFVGMEFESAEALKTFYKTYASHLGFGIRAGVLRRSRTDDAVIMRSFLCSREPPEFDSNGKCKRNQSTTREDCGAVIEVKRQDFNKWVVSKFVPEHTHALMPTSQLLGQSPSLSSHTTEKQTMPLFPSSMDSDAIEDGRSMRTNVGFSDDKVCGHIALQNGRHSADQSDFSLSYQEQDIFDLSEQVVQTDLTSTASDPKCEPFLGMEFGSSEAAEAFYYIYAKQTGFSVRKSFSRRSRRDDSIIMRSFVCAREGYHSMKISYGDGKRRQRKRMAVREGCKAMMEVVQRVQGKWVVTKFIKEHSHEVGGLTNVSCAPDGYENDAIPASNGNKKSEAVGYCALTLESYGKLEASAIAYKSMEVVYLRIADMVILRSLSPSALMNV
ncbi:Protein FAR1-RELATED SEQUENCE 7 [Acorus gramineus]|uniref:Protein FAR1-RELATED SEQUENCE 7 n=1 Tax=Acorus gramineus TaxID=55184 RepID=A0AAV9BA07_ACOGR|nr:Protein FAR1-RELATED SEQUENCE 7 [Acorus gramineus]